MTHHVRLDGPTVDKKLIEALDASDDDFSGASCCPRGVVTCANRWHGSAACRRSIEATTHISPWLRACLHLMPSLRSRAGRCGCEQQRDQVSASPCLAAWQRCLLYCLLQLLPPAALLSPPLPVPCSMNFIPVVDPRTGMFAAYSILSERASRAASRLAQRFS